MKRKEEQFKVKTKARTPTQRRQISFDDNRRLTRSQTRMTNRTPPRQTAPASGGDTASGSSTNTPRNANNTQNVQQGAGNASTEGDTHRELTTFVQQALTQTQTQCQASMQQEVLRMRQEMQIILAQFKAELTRATTALNSTTHHNRNENGDQQQQATNGYENISLIDVDVRPAEDRLAHDFQRPDGSRRTENGQYSASKLYVQVDKWGVMFEGGGRGPTVEDFIFRVEHLQGSYQVPWDAVIRDFHRLVDNQAKEWYWMFIRRRPNTNWAELKAALMDKFRSTKSDFEIRRDLVERKQLPGETIDNYFHEMAKLRALLINDIPECEMVSIIKKNLREGLARLVYPATIYNTEHLRQECIDIDKTFPPRNSIPRNQPIQMANTANQARRQYPLQVHEIQHPRNEQRFGNQKNNVNKGPTKINKKPHTEQNLPGKREFRCWNCRKLGHGFMECEEPRKIFCYKCGRENVVTPKCPNCTPVNSWRNMQPAGQACSLELPESPQQQ